MKPVKALVGILLLGLALVSPAHAVMIYDSALGTGAPDLQGWIYGQSPFAPPASGGLVAGGFQLDTTASSSTQAGFVRNLGATDSPVLNAVTGYELGFGLRIVDETHNNGNRAGFSFLAVGSDVSKSIEIGFWEDQVWAYEYSGGFVKGVYAALNTTVFHDYRLRVQGSGFQFFADNNLLFSGLLQDYSVSNTTVLGLIQPYADPNLIFWGDDTSSAQSNSIVQYVSHDELALPEPGSILLISAGLLLLVWIYAGRSSRR